MSQNSQIRMQQAKRIGAEEVDVSDEVEKDYDVHQRSPKSKALKKQTTPSQATGGQRLTQKKAQKPLIDNPMLVNQDISPIPLPMCKHSAYSKPYHANLNSQSSNNQQSDINLPQISDKEFIIFDRYRNGGQGQSANNQNYNNNYNQMEISNNFLQNFDSQTEHRKKNNQIPLSKDNKPSESNRTNNRNQQLNLSKSNNLINNDLPSPNQPQSPFNPNLSNNNRISKDMNNISNFFDNEVIEKPSSIEYLHNSHLVQKNKFNQIDQSAIAGNISSRSQPKTKDQQNPQNLQNTQMQYESQIMTTEMNNQFQDFLDFMKGNLLESKLRPLVDKDVEIINKPYTFSFQTQSKQNKNSNYMKEFVQSSSPNHMIISQRKLWVIGRGQFGQGMLIVPQEVQNSDSKNIQKEEYVIEFRECFFSFIEGENVDPAQQDNISYGIKVCSAFPVIFTDCAFIGVDVVNRNNSDYISSYQLIQDQSSCLDLQFFNCYFSSFQQVLKSRLCPKRICFEKCYFEIVYQDIIEVNQPILLSVNDCIFKKYNDCGILVKLMDNIQTTQSPANQFSHFQQLRELEYHKHKEEINQARYEKMLLKEQNKQRDALNSSRLGQKQNLSNLAMTPKGNLNSDLIELSQQIEEFYGDGNQSDEEDPNEDEFPYEDFLEKQNIIEVELEAEMESELDQSHQNQNQNQNQNQGLLASSKYKSKVSLQKFMNRFFKKYEYNYLTKSKYYTHHYASYGKFHTETQTQENNKISSIIKITKNEFSDGNLGVVVKNYDYPKECFQGFIDVSENRFQCLFNAGVMLEDLFVHKMVFISNKFRECDFAGALVINSKSRDGIMFYMNTFRVPKLGICIENSFTILDNCEFTESKGGVWINQNSVLLHNCLNQSVVQNNGFSQLMSANQQANQNVGGQSQRITGDTPINQQASQAIYQMNARGSNNHSRQNFNVPANEQNVALSPNQSPTDQQMRQPENSQISQVSSRQNVVANANTNANTNNQNQRRLGNKDQLIRSLVRSYLYNCKFSNHKKYSIFVANNQGGLIKIQDNSFKACQVGVLINETCKTSISKRNEALLRVNDEPQTVRTMTTERTVNKVLVSSSKGQIAIIDCNHVTCKSFLQKKVVNSFLICQDQYKN